MTQRTEVLNSKPLDKREAIALEVLKVLLQGQVQADPHRIALNAFQIADEFIARSLTYTTRR